MNPKRRRGLIFNKKGSQCLIKQCLLREKGSNFTARELWGKSALCNALFIKRDLLYMSDYILAIFKIKMVDIPSNVKVTFIQSTRTHRFLKKHLHLVALVFIG